MNTFQQRLVGDATNLAGPGWEKPQYLKEAIDGGQTRIFRPPTPPRGRPRSLDARHAGLLAFSQSRGFCPNGEGGGVTNSCSGEGGAKVMTAPDKDTGAGGAAPSPYKHFPSEQEALKAAVGRWKGQTSDLGIHVQDEIDGSPLPSSASGQKMREMAAAILKEVKENSKPAPTLYRGDDKTTGSNTSALVGWTSNLGVAEKWASKYGGTVQTLEGASGVKLSDIVGKTRDMGEDEWVVLNSRGTGVEPSSKPLPSYSNDIEHTMPKSKSFDDPKNSLAWLSPTGTFFPVSGDHGEYARAHGVEGGGDDLLDAGWVRVAGHSGDALFVGNPSGFAPKGRQLSSLKDFAISTGRLKRIVFDNGKSRIGRVLWQSDERALDARHASLLAFAESRDCGQDPDGKFSKGNTCAGGIAADAAKGAAAGAVLGGVSAFGKTFTPQAAASGAAVGAVAGAVKGIYDNKMRPTRVSARIEKVGMTDEKVAGLVKGLGGTRKSVASVNGKNGLTVTVRGRSGTVTHVVDITSKKVTIYPRAGRRELTDDQIDSIKKLAADSAPKETSIVVKTNSLSYATRLAKKGFVIGAKQAGSLVATAVGSAAAPSIPDAVLGTADLVFDTHFTDSFYKSEKHAKR